MLKHCRRCFFLGFLSLKWFEVTSSDLWWHVMGTILPKWERWGGSTQFLNWFHRERDSGYSNKWDIDHVARIYWEERERIQERFHTKTETQLSQMKICRWPQYNEGYSNFDQCAGEDIRLPTKSSGISARTSPGSTWKSTKALILIIIVNAKPWLDSRTRRKEHTSYEISSQALLSELVPITRTRSIRCFFTPPRRLSDVGPWGQFLGGHILNESKDGCSNRAGRSDHWIWIMNFSLIEQEAGENENGEGWKLLVCFQLLLAKLNAQRWDLTILNNQPIIAVLIPMRVNLGKFALFLSLLPSDLYCRERYISRAGRVTWSLWRFCGHKVIYAVRVPHNPINPSQWFDSIKHEHPPNSRLSRWYSEKWRNWNGLPPGHWIMCRINNQKEQ
jgi:hypothetical protein